MGFYKEKTFLFYKYLLSYLVIFLIPFITISFFFYHVSTKVIKDEIVKSNVSKLEQVRDISDTRMREMKNIATHISLDHRMTPYMLTQPYVSKQAIRELTTYSVDNASIDGLFLYFDDHDYIYTSSGTATFDTYTKKTFGIHAQDITELKKEIRKNNEPVTKKLRMNAANHHVVSYIFPISPGSPTPYGKVVFLIKETKYHDLMKHVLGSFNGTNYLFDQNKNLITSNNNGDTLSSSVVNQLPAADDKKVIHTEINGEEYSFVSAHSELTGWTFVSAMPTKQFFGPLSSLQQIILIILAIVGLIGIIIIFFMTSQQYKPINKLVKLLKNKQLGNEKEWKGNDEITNIRESIYYISERSHTLQQRMKEQEPYVRDQILLQLLKGDTQDNIDINEILSDLNITFLSDYFFIIAISHNNKADYKAEERNAELLSLLSKLEMNHCIGYGVELIHNQTYGLIVTMNSKTEKLEQNRTHFVETLLEQLTKYSHDKYSIGVGEICQGVDKINRSYIEAKAALEYSIINSTGSFVYFEDISRHENYHLWYPIDDQVKLKQSLKQGNYIVAKEVLDDIMNHIKMKKAPIFMTKSMSYDVINAVLKTITEMGILYDVEQVKNLVQFQSIEELNQHINQLVRNVCDEIERRKVKNNNTLCNRIIEYIESEYACPNFSLDNVAEHFQLSPSYTSRFIKEQTGQTFTQVVWRLRIEKCKDLLLNTSRPIKDIVAEIGYLDVANFTRKFKKTVGVTPGQYRKSYIYTETQSENMS